MAMEDLTVNELIQTINTALRRINQGLKSFNLAQAPMQDLANLVGIMDEQVAELSAICIKLQMSYSQAHQRRRAEPSINEQQEIAAKYLQNIDRTRQRMNRARFEDPELYALLCRIESGMDNPQQERLRRHLEKQRPDLFASYHQEERGT